ncbi:ComF family protein [Streptomyces sp. NPDC057757]|uniref:ComF family protein n=1 Tax=Streptomyces sp. NPDC057757 TaxID=3346241 RepID=UPI0036AC4ACF
MRGWWQDLTDLVLPAECGGCGRPRTVLCSECRAALTGAAPSRVRPVPEPAGLPVVHAAVPYGDEVRAVLLAHKERGVLPLAGPLGGALAGAVRAGLGCARLPVPDGPLMGVEGRLSAGNGQVRAAGRSGEGGGSSGMADGRRRSSGSRGEYGGWPGGPGSGPGAGGERLSPGRVGPGGSGMAGAGAVLLVPVPSSRRAVRARGHDPARRIALAAAGELRRTGTPARVLAVLRQRRAVADQSGLNSRQRLANLAGALEVAPGGERLLAGGGRIVLVDDLMTTGASLTEAARAVRAGVPYTGSADDAYRAAAWAAAGERRPDATTARAVGEPPTARTARHMPGGRRAGNDTRTDGAGEVTGVGGAGVMICAAVVAAPSDSFEINRN